jgi:hypothetical protein
MNEWLAILFFIGLLLVIAEHNSKEFLINKKTTKRERSKSY